MDDMICPQCGGPGRFLGVLGKYANYRCRNCGWVFRDDGLLEPISEECRKCGFTESACICEEFNAEDEDDEEGEDA